MEKELVQLEQAVHAFTYMETDGPGQLLQITQQLKHVVQEYYVNEGDVEVLKDTALQLEDAEMYLKTLRPDNLNINDWKHNIQSFSKAKGLILYSLNLLQAALRFGRLPVQAAEVSF